MTVRSYRDLRVWQRSIDLVCATYAIVRMLPAEERGALGDQLRRSSASIPANIAEGHSRVHRKEFLQFLAIAQASLTELETHLTIAHRVGHISAHEVALPMDLCTEVGRMLTAMRVRLGFSHSGASSRQTPLAKRP